ncbi:MBL fold metallo-hydrolase [Pelotomaculum propionicicum]|uniref:MBL fold metallo-hydrolase n=1 Tax=Pelotomaculum propionicicum TaxID=258475 RepID=UPI003B77BCAD
MKIICLESNPQIYSCRSYLVLGSWNRLEDINTLVDIGADGYIIKQISKTSTGVGKRPVEQVIITHGHFDHAGGLGQVKEAYKPMVYANARSEEADRIISDGEIIRMGDRDFEVIYSPGHSNDSICLYCPQDKVLFSGDTPLQIRTPGGSYSAGFVKSLEKIASRDIRVIYSGHDQPITENVGEMIRYTLVNVNKSKIVS